MTNYEMTEKLSEKMGITLEEAKTALEASDWDMLEAALLLEKEHGTEGGTYTTRREQKSVDEDTGRKDQRVLTKLGVALKKLLDMGNRNHFEVRRKDSEDLVIDMPTTVVVLLLFFAFWVCVPLLVIGLFAGFRYSFSGKELGRDSINSAMDKAGEAADKVIDEIRSKD
ncbi:MAG: ubiquitin [Clostridiales bacterium]|nr:ubiquitin [Clostridiales bacterium]